MGKSLIVPQQEQKEGPLSINKPVQRVHDNFYDYSPKRTYTTSPQILAQDVIKTARKKTLYSPSTTLQQLYRWNLLTQKECRRCHKKRLYTIGDVQQKIKKYNLTPDSTRFTKYTLDTWFKIVRLLDASEQYTKKESTPISISSSSGREISDRIYVIFTQKIMKMHQFQRHGVVNVAKPVLFLTILDGVTKGEILYNRIFLDDWLERRYNSLMKRYSNLSIFKNVTPINMPFWHLETDGFWHLRIKDTKETNMTPTIQWLKENVMYASLDDDLWNLIQNKECLMKLREFIIQNKLQAAEEDV